MAKDLKNILLLDKGGLICIFEEIFGHNKAPQYEVNNLEILQQALS